MAVSQAFIFHFKCYDVMHFAVGWWIQLLPYVKMDTVIGMIFFPLNSIIGLTYHSYYHSKMDYMDYMNYMDYMDYMTIT